MYLYEGHLGGLYTTCEILDFEELYCESCGDSDWLLGEFETEQELRELLLYYHEYDGLCDYDIFDEYYTKEDWKNEKKEILKTVEEQIKEFM